MFLSLSVLYVSDNSKSRERIFIKLFGGVRCLAGNKRSGSRLFNGTFALWVIVRVLRNALEICGHRMLLVSII